MTDDTPKVTLVKDLDELYDSRRNHSRNALAGTEVRIASGAYVDRALWDGLDRRSRYLLRVRTVSATRLHPPVLSHWSAAAIHGLPSIEQWPTWVHVTDGMTAGGRSNGAVVRHHARLSDDDVVQVGDLLVTSVARTVLDLAADFSEMASVVALDRALHVERRGVVPALTTLDDVWRAYSARMPFRAHARARNAIEFAVPVADSPLESVSRVNMRVAGLPRPVLQHRFDDYRGLIGFSEFYWPQHHLAGEADGRSKYTDPQYRHGRSLEQLLLDEKERADRIRAIGPDVSRWNWATAVHPEALRRHLIAAGLPTDQAW